LIIKERVVELYLLIAE